MSTIASRYTEEMVQVGATKVYLLKGGQGSPLLVLPDDLSIPDWLPFHDNLASHFSVYAPSHPGFVKSERPNWMRSVRDLAVMHMWLLKVVGLERVSVVGLGFGGWVAAEMATMSERQFQSMVLINPVGVQPTEGEIQDQFMMFGHEFIKLAFHDKSKFDDLYGAEPSVDNMEAWEINREMVARIAFKPYLFSQTLPHLLPSVNTPTLVVRTKEDTMVPPSCAQRYVDALPNARLEIVEGSGHYADVEKPDELASLIINFIPQ